MRPIPTERVAWSICRYVCRPTGWLSPAENVRTDQDAVWGIDLGRPEKPHITDGVVCAEPLTERYTFEDDILGRVSSFLTAHQHIIGH